MLLEKIQKPSDIKGLSKEELVSLASEIRAALTQKTSEHGGHIGPNYGVVEITIALHKVFNSPMDKIVFDISHQTYPHKMLTGRAYGFLDRNRYDDITGYSSQDESEHDFFKLGHTSTSVSLALGMAKARDLKGDHENIIAVIGDGSLSGGEAYEGLSNAAEQGTNFIIIANDNDMSIAENHGGLYRNLKELRETKGNAKTNYFTALGLDYKYVEDGHNIQNLIEVFESVKDIDHPIVLHIHTQKGKGLPFAEKDREPWHWNFPYDPQTGEVKVKFDEPDYGDLTAQYLLAEMKKDPTVVGITSGTPSVMGFSPERRKEAGKQFVDVGIAEEHAVALASGIATNGGKPVYGVFSTFMQRTYDQMMQDLSINKSPATILVFLASAYALNDVTHIGFYDIPFLTSIPNMIYLAPTCKEEYFAQLAWSMKQTEQPVAIRVPVFGGVVERGTVDTTDYSILNKSELTKKGDTVAIIGVGDFYQKGEKVVELLAAKGINASLINPKFLSGLDTELLESLKKDHKIVITLEDGQLEGGYGERVASFYGPSDIKVINFGIRKEFLDRYDVEELIKQNHLTEEQIVEDVMRIL